MLAGDLDEDALERLRAQAVGQGLTVRQLASRILESASMGRHAVVIEPPPERSSSARTEEARRGTPSIVPVFLRVGENVAERRSPSRYQRPRVADGDIALPENENDAVWAVARELELVRKTSLWAKLVDEGYANELLSAPIAGDEPEPEEPGSA
jgi:hypothetical protein